MEVEWHLNVSFLIIVIFCSTSNVELLGLSIILTLIHDDSPDSKKKKDLCVSSLYILF